MGKILHIVPLARRAGLQVMFINYLNEIKKTNPNELKNHIVFAMNFSNELINEVEDIGVKCYKAKRSSKMDLRVISQIKKVIDKQKIKIIYGQNSTGNLWAVLTHVIAPKTKLICHEHGTAWGTDKKISQFFTNRWLKRADRVIANSHATKALLEEKFNANGKKIDVIYNGIPKKEAVEGIEKKDNQLLFVGRLDEVKSPVTIIDAIKILRKDNFEVHVVFLGDGPLLDTLHKRVVQLGIQDMVTFKGSVHSDEVSRYMAESSFLVLPSIRESLGNVIIEAAMQNTAAIAAKVDGIPEVITDESFGRLIKPTKPISGKGVSEHSVDPETYTLNIPKQIDPSDLALIIMEELSQNQFKEKGIKAGNVIPKRHQISDYVIAINKIYLDLLK